MNIFRYKNIFWQLLKTDLLLFGTEIKDKVINAIIWIAASVLVMSYLMPAFGLSRSYSSFFAASSIAGIGNFEMFAQLVNFLADIDGDKHINYLFTLPIPNKLLLIKNVCIFSINSLFLSAIAFTCCKLLIWHQFDLTKINFFHFFVVCIALNIQYSFFVLFLSSMVRGMSSLRNTFIRIVFPLWISGCYQFSWVVMYGSSKIMAYINFLNPYVYGMEGTRSALLGKAGSLPFWYCIAALVIFSSFWGIVGITKLKKRLDFV